MVAALLLHLEEFDTAAEALAFYGQARTHNGAGVTIPSQRRFVGYYERVLRQQRAGLSAKESIGPGRKLTLDRVVLSTVPHFDSDGGCDPYMIVYNGDGRVYNQKLKSPPVHVNKGSAPIELFADSTCVELFGAVKLEIWDYDLHSADEAMCSAWFHCDMLDPATLQQPSFGNSTQRAALTLVKAEIDGPHLDKKVGVVA